MTQQVVVDEVLGRLVWDRRYEWWSGEALLSAGHEVGVSIETEADDDAVVFQRARRAFQRVRAELSALRRAAAAELLPVYNESWSEAGPIDAADFASRMTLSDITFYADGSAEVYFDAGEMFDGHSIVVSVTPDGEVDDASIAG